MWASHFNHWMRVSFVEPHVWASTLWHFSSSSLYWPVFFFSAMRYSLSSLTKRNHFGHIDGANPIVLFSLWKTTPAFIRVNKERQARLTGNYSGSQSFSSEMVSKRVRRICTMKTISGLVRSGSPWSIIGLHLDNVGHDTPVWSQILSSPILFKKVTTMIMMHLKVTGKRTSLVQSHILPSPILFKEVTTTRNPCSLEQNLPLSEGSRLCAGRDFSSPDVRVKTECSTAFRPWGTSSLTRGEEVDLLF